MDQQDANTFTPSETVDLKKLASATALSALLFMIPIVNFFTPYPIGLTSIMYGRKSGAIVGVLSSVLVFALVSYLYKESFTTVGVFALIAVQALAIVEFIRMRINPLKIVIGVSISSIALVSLVYLASLNFGGKTHYQQAIDFIETNKEFVSTVAKNFKDNTQKGSFELAALWSDKDKLAKEFVSSGKIAFCLGCVIFVWFQLFVFLKFNRILIQTRGLSGIKAAYTERHLLYEKVPEQLVFVIILSLAGTLIGEGTFASVSKISLICFGCLYFFRGFGIYLSFLDKYNVYGGLRFFLVSSTMFMMLMSPTMLGMLAMLGLLELVVDYNKFFKKE